MTDHRSTTSPSDFQMVFLTGASGSGTTLLTRILSSPSSVMTIGGKHRAIKRDGSDLFRQASRFNRLTKRMWDRAATLEQYHKAQRELLPALERIQAHERANSISHFLFKRSAPFYNGDQYRPDLFDLIELFPQIKIVVAYRDPRASTYSSFRREFAENLHYASVICSEQLAYLSAQLAALPPEQVYVVGYEAYCTNPLPLTRDLATFLGIDAAGTDEMLRTVEAEKVDPTTNDRWQRECDPDDADFLNRFFGARQPMWGFLHETAHSTAVVQNVIPAGAD